MSSGFIGFWKNGCWWLLPVATVCAVAHDPTKGDLSIYTGNGSRDAEHHPIPDVAIPSVLMKLRAAGWPVVQLEAVDE